MRILIIIAFFQLLFQYNLDAQAARLVDHNPNGSDVDNFGFNVLSSGKLIYPGTNGLDGQELWISDGTPAGTKMLADIWPGAESSNPSNGIEFQGDWYFKAQRNGNNGLYKVNPSSGVTTILKEFTGIDSSYKVEAIYPAVNGRLIVPFTRSNPTVRKILTTDGTATGTKTICDDCRIMKINSNVFGNAVFNTNNKFYRNDGNSVTYMDSLPTNHRPEFILNYSNRCFVFSRVWSDSTLFVHELLSNFSLQQKVDSIKYKFQLIGGSFSYSQFADNQKILISTHSDLIKFDPVTRKLSRVPVPRWSNKSGVLDIVPCGGSLYMYGEESATKATPALYRFEPNTLAYTKLLSKDINLADNKPERPDCFGSTLVGEWQKSLTQNGVFVLKNATDTLYFESGSSWSVRVVGNKVFWIGDGSDNQCCSLWSLDLTTVPTTEPLPAQLDLSVHPTITTDGVFYLGGTDAQTDLMSAQLVNSAGSITHVNTQVSTGEPLSFGTKAPGVYFVYLLSKDGRRFMQKVVYR
jgi:ELWxxDGT repeat protein